MRDILLDGIPILDLLEITASTTIVSALTQCDQSCVSRLYRHVSDQLGLGFRKTSGHYRAHTNQPILRSLRKTSQLLRLAKGHGHLQWVGHPLSPLPLWSLDAERTLELLRERVLDLALIDRPSGFLPIGETSPMPLHFDEWVVIDLASQRHSSQANAVVLRHDNLEQPALMELIASLSSKSEASGNTAAHPLGLPFARVVAIDACHDFQPAPGHPDRRDAGSGQCRAQPQPAMAPGTTRSPGRTPQTA